MLIGQVGRAFRAIILLCAIAGGAPAVLRAGPLEHADIDAIGRPAEPFGLPTSVVRRGELNEKWLGLERELADELTVLALCEEHRENCSLPARRFLDMVAVARDRDGRARLGEINRGFNLAIRAISDQAQYGATDVWRAPLGTLAAGAGDCEDYAIAKWVALRAAGIAAEDLRLVILRDTLRHEDHAVAAARLDGRWWLLDNRRMAMVEDVDARHLQPLFVIDHDGVRQYRNEPAPVVAAIVQPSAAAWATLASLGP